MYKIFTILFVLLLFLGVFYWWNFKKESAEEIELRLGFNANSVNYAPIMIGLDAGIYQKNGLKIKPFGFTAGKEVGKALTANQIDVGAASCTSSFAPISKNVPIKIIATSTSSRTYLFVRKNSKIEKLKDLENKTIGGGLGGSSNLFLRIVFKKERIDFNKIKFVEIKKPYFSIALSEKKVVDGIVASEYNKFLLLKEDTIVLPEWEEKGYAQQFIPTTVILGQEEFVKKNPQLIKKFLKAHKESIEFITQNKEKAAELISDHIAKSSEGSVIFTKEDVLTLLGTVEFSLWINPEEIIALAKEAKEVGFIDKDLNKEDLFDNNYANF